MLGARHEFNQFEDVWQPISIVARNEVCSITQDILLFSMFDLMGLITKIEKVMTNYKGSIYSCVGFEKKKIVFTY